MDFIIKKFSNKFKNIDVFFIWKLIIFLMKKDTKIKIVMKYITKNINEDEIKLLLNQIKQSTK